MFFLFFRRENPSLLQQLLGRSLLSHHFLELLVLLSKHGLKAEISMTKTGITCDFTPPKLEETFEHVCPSNRTSADGNSAAGRHAAFSKQHELTGRNDFHRGWRRW